MFCQIKFLSQNLQTKIRIKISLYGGEKERATPYILKAKKFAEPLFQSKKIAEKCVNPGIIFGPFGGNCGPFRVIFGPLRIILGHSRAILGHLGSYLGHFGPFWVIFGPFCGIFAESSNFLAGSLVSRDLLLECMYKFLFKTA